MNKDQLLESFLEVTFKTEDDFNIIAETLTRMGLPSSKQKRLHQSCYILHKHGKYYIVHFKEMFMYDNISNVDFTKVDISRRNKIARRLEEWDLISVVDQSVFDDEETNQDVPLKTISFGDKSQWELVKKYTIGHNG